MNEETASETGSVIERQGMSTLQLHCEATNDIILFLQ